jgi:hypothetical protein
LAQTATTRIRYNKGFFSNDKRMNKLNPLLYTILVVMVLRVLGPDFNLKPSKSFDGPQIGLIYLGTAIS